MLGHRLVDESRLTEASLARAKAKAAAHETCLVDAFTCDEVDFEAELADPLPIEVTCELLGVPESENDSVRSWTAELGRVFATRLSDGQRARCESAIENLSSLLGDLFEARKRHPRPDVLSALVAASEAPGGATGGFVPQGRLRALPGDLHEACLFLQSLGNVNDLYGDRPPVHDLHGILAADDSPVAAVAVDVVSVDFSGRLTRFGSRRPRQCACTCGSPHLCRPVEHELRVAHLARAARTAHGL